MILKSHLIYFEHGDGTTKIYFKWIENVGFALLTPFASIIFQWIISPKGAYFEHSMYAVISLILSIIAICIGSKFIEEKK